MEIIITAISLILLAGLLLCPIFVLRLLNRKNIKFKFIVYVAVGSFLTAFIIIIFAWWAYTSDLILLKQYGYDIDGMNEAEFYGNVLPENMDKVKSIEISVMGIGWPLKAFLMFVFYSPYLLLVYIATYLIGNRSKKTL